MLHRLPRLISQEGFSFIKRLEVDCNLCYYYAPDYILYTWRWPSQFHTLGRLKREGKAKDLGPPDSARYERMWEILASMNLQTLRLCMETDRFEDLGLSTQSLEQKWLAPIEKVKHNTKMITFDLMLCESWFNAAYFQTAMARVDIYTLVDLNLPSFRILKWRGPYIQGPVCGAM